MKSKLGKVLLQDRERRLESGVPSISQLQHWPVVAGLGTDIAGDPASGAGSSSKVSKEGLEERPSCSVSSGHQALVLLQFRACELQKLLNPWRETRLQAPGPCSLRSPLALGGLAEEPPHK